MNGRILERLVVSLSEKDKETISVGLLGGMTVDILNCSDPQIGAAFPGFGRLFCLQVAAEADQQVRAATRTERDWLSHKKWSQQLLGTLIRPSSTMR